MPPSASQTELLNSATTVQENSSKSTTPIRDVYFKEQKKNKLTLIETTVLNTLQCFESDPLPESIWVRFSKMFSQAFLPS